MGGINKTGVPSTDSYNLGRGRLYAGTLDANEKPTVFRDLGNCPEFTIGLETETLEHQSSRQGLRVTDKEITISQTVNLNVTLDNLEFDNLAIFFSATILEYTSTSVAITDRVLISNTDIDSIKGRWIDLIDNSGERIYNLANPLVTTTDFELEAANNSGFTSSTVLVLGTDYLLDYAQARVFVVYNSTTISGFSGAYWFRYTVTDAGNVGAAIDEIQLFQQTTQSVALKFISENPANNDEQTEWQFHKVALKAEGDISMIGDEFSQIPMSGVAEEAPLADPDAPVGRARTYAGAGS